MNFSGPRRRSYVNFEEVACSRSVVTQNVRRSLVGLTGACLSHRYGGWLLPSTSHSYLTPLLNPISVVEYRTVSTVTLSELH